MFKKVLQKLMSGEKLARDEAYQVMQQILAGEATSAQISSFITILTFRGVTTQELTGLTQAMRDSARKLAIADDEPLIDTCGTGGDLAGTFNISTASALVASSSGLKVAKHGNRSVSSLSGSADVLEELGLEVEVSPEQIATRLNEDHMCFMYAPIYHQAMKHAAGARKEIGFRSVFNLLGPLTNPANTKFQVIGVYDRQYSLPMAETLRELGSEHVLIVHGDDGLDELSITTSTHVTELKDGEIKQYTLTPEEFGLSRYPISHIQVASPRESARVILDVLQRKRNGAVREIVLFNAGAALYVGQKVTSIREGVELAKELIDSGRAYEHYLKIKRDKGALRYAE